MQSVSPSKVLSNKTYNDKKHQWINLPLSFCHWECNKHISIPHPMRCKNFSAFKCDLTYYMSTQRLQIFRTVGTYFFYFCRGHYKIYICNIYVSTNSYRHLECPWRYITDAGDVRIYTITMFGWFIVCVNKTHKTGHVPICCLVVFQHWYTVVFTAAEMQKCELHSGWPHFKWPPPLIKFYFNLKNNYCVVPRRFLTCQCCLLPF
jgi:hypothetical protein